MILLWNPDRDVPYHSPSKRIANYIKIALYQFVEVFKTIRNYAVA